MKADDRRKELIRFLMSEQNPVPGVKLASRFGVSRQIIVQDISVLKAAGYEIIPTHYGYILRQTPFVERIFKVCHSTEQTEEELSLITGLGGMVVDVFVWHKAYGKVEAKLNIFSASDVRQFIENVRSGTSSELMNITGGYHYHTVQADSEEILDQIEEALDKKGYTVPEI